MNASLRCAESRIFRTPVSRSRVTHSFDDPAVRATPAHIAFHVADNLLFAGIWRARKQCSRRNNHARRAIGALECFDIEKSLLYRMQAVSAAQPFDGDDFFPGGRGNRQQAGTLGRSVNQYGTSTALPFAATVLGASQAQVVAQNIQQRLPRLNFCVLLRAINEKGESHFACASAAQHEIIDALQLGFIRGKVSMSNLNQAALSSSSGSGIEDGGSLAGKLSSIVLSRLSCSSRVGGFVAGCGSSAPLGSPCGNFGIWASP